MTRDESCPANGALVGVLRDRGHCAFIKIGLILLNLNWHIRRISWTMKTRQYEKMGKREREREKERTNNELEGYGYYN